MHEGFSDEEEQVRPQESIAVDVSVSWSPESGTPPPLTSEYGYDVSSETETSAKEENNEGQEGVEDFHVPILDRDLTRLGVSGQEEMDKFLSEKNSLPAESMIDIYHGLNGGLAAALAVLESPENGVKQISGPCLSVYPVGQFWKPGDAGFKYSISRELIEFPGESKPDAQFKIDKGGTVFLSNGLESLPITDFKAEVMRTVRKEDVVEEQLDEENTWRDVVVGERVVALTDKEIEVEKKIAEKIKELKEQKLASEKEKEQIDDIEASIRTVFGE